jgi:hypothetical protein
LLVQQNTQKLNTAGGDRNAMNRKVVLALAGLGIALIPVGFAVEHWREVRVSQALDKQPLLYLTSTSAPCGYPLREVLPDQ